MEYIGKNISRLRIKIGLTQIELAKLVNKSQKDISRWESGERIPKADSIILLSQALECSTDDILLNND